MDKPKQILILHSSTEGHTVKICKQIALKIQNKYNNVEICNMDMLEEANQNYIAKFQLIIIGASVRYGDFNKKVYSFIKNNIILLSTRKTAFFGVNLVARKEHKSTTEQNPYMKKFLKKSLWKPDHIEVFAGALDYSKYKRFDKLMILMIMFLTKGPTDTSKRYVFTKWNKVKSFSSKIAEINI